MLQKYDIFKILEPFLNEPSKGFHLRELSRLLKWGPGKVERNIRDFVERGIILERKEKIFKIYRANKESEDLKLLKLIYTLIKLQDLVIYLEKELNYPEAIILFGSARRGEDDEDSDVDICILGREKELPLEKFEKDLNRRISLLFLSKEKIDRLKNDDPEIVNNVLNGIV
ncbi:MAG: nucleotidyltransferase domain-containing protein, partial [Candidatus Hydrothermarchaeales archaeon]